MGNCVCGDECKLCSRKVGKVFLAIFGLGIFYVSAVITCWEKGGVEPIYVCDSHAKELGPSREHGPEARILTAEAVQSDNPINQKKRSPTPEMVIPKPNGAPFQETEHGLEDRIEKAKTENRKKPIKAEERTPSQEISVAKSNGAPVPEVAQSAAEPKAGRGANDASARARTRDLT